MITQTSPFALRRRRTLRSWLSSVMKSFDHRRDGIDGTRAESAQSVSIGTGVGAERRALPFEAGGREPSRGEVVPFPLNGEALLIRLAEVLRRHVADLEPGHNPLSLTISRCPQARLSIDDTAYVDFLSDISTYCAAIEAAPDTKVILNTTDFDALASFVMQYVDQKLLDQAAMVASP
jgi:hypothetical protein